MNTQKIEKVLHAPETGEHGQVDVIRIWKTIQGEGPYAGTRAIFIRLAGCNLQCPLCDTEYTENRIPLTPEDIVKSIKRLWIHGTPAPGCDEIIGELVVITGGEPFRQDITPLVMVLLDAGLMVQIETNGTIYRDEFPYDLVTIVCSPKTSFVEPRLHRHIDAYKYVVQAGHVDLEDGLPTSALGYGSKPARPKDGHPDVQVYVQPCDEADPKRNNDNIQAAVGSCLVHGYRLCLQMHKYAGVD